MTAMDPRLQWLVARRRHGMAKMASSSTGVDEVAVLAKITDRDAWEGLSEVTVGATVGPPAQDGTLIVTGRIPLSRVEFVRRQSFVTSLKAAQRLTPSLHATIREIGARADLSPQGNLANGGSGVVVGIIDFGLDFAHRNFCLSNGSSRVAALWDQNGPTSADSPYGYGKLYRKADIDQALTKQDPYAALGYGPPPDPPAGPRGTHGTHVADIAAGNGRGSGTPGVAPQADIIFVEIAASDIPWSGEEVVGKSFGDSVQLLEAIQFVLDEAGTRPCAINLSLGTNGGPHDGTTLVEEGIDRLLRAAPNRAVAIAASNSYADGIHASGDVPADGTLDLNWEIPSVQADHNELEIWYSGPDRLTLEIIAPDGSSLGSVSPGTNKSIQHQGKVVLFAASRLDDPNNHDNTIGVYLEESLPAGQWTMRLHGDSVQSGRVHAWIERNDAGQSQFAAPHDNSQTIGSISCGHETVVVGSYDAHKASVPLSYFSSAGPTRDGREKPEISAPGHNVLAARSRTGNGTVRKSGTSMAAPATTGVIALVLAEANARQISLSNQQIRTILANTARKNPPPGTVWHDRYGNGRIFASGAVQEVIQLAPALPVTPLTAARKLKARGKKKPQTRKPRNVKQPARGKKKTAASRRR
ncbi:MAG: S8 family peptidase [Planctomycetes bacterium]|nr:S8 family peptidase [Planctomycetota bacterium]